MRLIDADKLIKHLTNWRLKECPVGICDEETETYKTICKCIEAVKEQPTAYDVEKVVEELEFKKSYLKNNGLVVSVPVVTLEEAIDIVKAGGKEVNED